jgi:hypothetical protein
LLLFALLLPTPCIQSTVNVWNPLKP